MHYPFILAFEPTFIEVRHVESGNLVQIVTGSNIRCLFSDTPPSQIHAANMPRPGQMGPYPYGQPAMTPHPSSYPYGPGGNPGVHMAPPAPPSQPMNRLQRNQIIFVSDDGNVQVVRLNRDHQGMLPVGPPLMPNGSMSRR